MSGSGSSKNGQTITPQQLAILRGMAGNAPVQQAQASMPGQAGLLGSAQSGLPNAPPGQPGQAPGMQAPGPQAPGPQGAPSGSPLSGVNPQIVQMLMTQYPQLFSGGGGGQ